MFPSLLWFVLLFSVHIASLRLFLLLFSVHIDSLCLFALLFSVHIASLCLFVLLLSVQIAALRLFQNRWSLSNQQTKRSSLSSANSWGPNSHNLSNLILTGWIKNKTYDTNHFIYTSYFPRVFECLLRHTAPTKFKNGKHSTMRMRFASLARWPSDRIMAKWQMWQSWFLPL